jgi:hypothetical protein
MTTHTEETIASAMALACLLIALFGYPFGGTSIVPFDAYGRCLLRHRRHLLRVSSVARFKSMFAEARCVHHKPHSHFCSSQTASSQTTTSTMITALRIILPRTNGL